jgi:hypothetical protein
MDKDFKNNLAEISQYMRDNGANVYPFPSVKLNTQPQDAKSIECTTGYYDPQEKLVVLFTSGRHPKDVLRSFAHEMIHHDQNLSGEMTSEKIGEGGNDPKYTQNNPHLRKLEEDAYLRGNMMFRDWTDSKKYGK